MSTGVGTSSCCLSGTIAQGTPKGREETIAGMSTYVAEPESGSTGKAVVFIVDSTSFPQLSHPYGTHSPLTLIPLSLRLEAAQCPPPRRQLR